MEERGNRVGIVRLEDDTLMKRSVMKGFSLKISREEGGDGDSGVGGGTTGGKWDEEVDRLINVKRG